MVFDVNRNLLLGRKPQGQRVCSPTEFGLRKKTLLALGSDGRGLGFQAVIDLCSIMQGQRLCFPVFGLRRKNPLAACGLNGQWMWPLGVMDCCGEGIVEMEGVMLKAVDPAQADEHKFRPRTTYCEGGRP